MTVNQNIPALRFPEFDGDWEIKELNKIAERVVKKNNENNLNVLTISAQLGLISQLEFFNKSVSAKDVSGYYLLEQDDFAYNKSYSNGYPMGAIKRLNRYSKGVVSTLYICFKFKDTVNSTFFEQYFEAGKQNSEIEKFAQEGARNHGLLNIGVNDFFKINVQIPSTAEQQKIATFLTAVDEKIQQLARKKDILEQYKKGVLQKIFNQEIRFKDDNGNDFADWEEKKLDEVGEINPKCNKLPNSFIYIDLESVQDGNLMKENKINLENAPSRAQRLLEKNDILYQTVRPYQKNNLFFDRDGIYVASTGYAQIRTKNNAKFLYQYLHTDSFVNEVLLRCTGTGYPAINSTDLSNIKINLPSIPEQQRIANFLSAIDEKINLVSQQLEKTRNYKKGLLQQMFV